MRVAQENVSCLYIFIKCNGRKRVNLFRFLKIGCQISTDQYCILIYINIGVEFFRVGAKKHLKIKTACSGVVADLQQYVMAADGTMLKSSATLPPPSLFGP